jgi:hypothetical protein
MVELSIKHDVEKITRNLKQFRRQVPFATSKALNITALKARDALEKETRQVFSKPTRFTQKPVWIEFAKKTRLRAAVTIKDVQHKYLDAEIQGGGRRLKRFELHLYHAGLLPAGMYAVPAKGVRLNKFGNLTQGAITKMLSNLQSHPDPLLNTPKTYATGQTSNKRFFVARIKGAFGVWQRVGKHRKRLYLLFVKQPRYTKRYQYRRLVRLTVKRHFADEFARQFQAAIKTAK